MQHPAARLAILVLLALPGCGGCRVYRYGFGRPRMRVHRSVWCKADWSLDDRFVLVSVTKMKRVFRARFSIVPYDSYEDEPRERQILYRVPADGSEEPTRLGYGTQLTVCPAGTYAAFVEPLEPAEEGEPPPRRLWLVDYAAEEPEPVALDDDLAHFSFSHDGKWLAWSSAAPGTWRVIAVDRPSEPHELSPALAELRDAGWLPRRWGMPRDRWRWSTDGALYRLLTRFGTDRTTLTHRWVRFVPPDWTVEDLGRLPKDAPPEALRDEAPRRPHGLARSRDGALLLRVGTEERIRAGTLYALGFASRTYSIANVFVLGPRRSSLQLTDFRPPR